MPAEARQKSPRTRRVVHRRGGQAAPASLFVLGEDEGELSLPPFDEPSPDELLPEEPLSVELLPDEPLSAEDEDLLSERLSVR